MTNSGTRIAKLGHHGLKFLMIINSLIKKLLSLIINPLERLNNGFNRLSLINSVQGWSVVVITGAQDLTMLEQVLSSIDRELAGTAAEIIIIGPASLKLNSNYHLPIKHFSYRDSKILRPLITLKKNIGVALCQYDKVVLMHDYIIFEPGWKKGWDDYGDNFEVAVNCILNKDGSRYRDWLVWDYPSIGPALLPYNYEFSQYQYVSGTYFIVKKDFYLTHPLNSSLRWGEGEDVEWSLSIRNKINFKFNANSAVKCAKQKEPMGSGWDNNSLLLSKLLNDPNNV